MKFSTRLVCLGVLLLIFIGLFSDKIDVLADEYQSLEDFRQIFYDCCTTCSSDFADLRFCENDDGSGQYGELFFSPTFFADNFDYDKNNLFKDVGCELESVKSGSRYIIRPYFDDCGDNAVALSAYGDCAKLKFYISFENDPKIIPSAAHLDNYHTGTNEFKFCYGYDEGFRFVDGEVFNVCFFKKDIVQAEGDWVDFDLNLSKGCGQSQFKETEIVARFQVKSKNCGLGGFLSDVLRESDHDQLKKFFSSFKHLDKFDEAYSLRLLKEDEKYMINSLEKGRRKLARN